MTITRSRCKKAWTVVRHRHDTCTCNILLVNIRIYILWVYDCNGLPCVLRICVCIVYPLNVLCSWQLISCDIAILDNVFTIARGPCIGLTLN